MLTLIAFLLPWFNERNIVMVSSSKLELQMPCKDTSKLFWCIILRSLDLNSGISVFPSIYSERKNEQYQAKNSTLHLSIWNTKKSNQGKHENTFVNWHTQTHSILGIYDSIFDEYLAAFAVSFNQSQVRTWICASNCDYWNIHQHENIPHLWDKCDRI